MKRVLTVLLFVLPLWPCDRPQQTMGRYIQSAELIAIADVANDPAGGSVTVTFREFLKGNSGTKGTTTIRGRSCPYVPEGKGYAILLSPGWQSAEWPVVEVYNTPADVADLRALAKVYALTSERQRLDAIRALSNSASPRYREQLFDDLRNMREPANYAIVQSLYPSLDKAGRSKLVELIAYIGDLRGVPVLLEAVKRPDPDVAESARQALRTYFPSVTGVSEVLKSHPSPPQKENEMQRAFRLFKEGRKAEAVPLLRVVATDERESATIRMWAALDVIDEVDAAAKNTLRTTMWPLLVRIVREGNYLEIVDAARILRGLKHPDNLPLLLQLLGRKEFVGQKTPYIAVMAIRELGPGVRTKAVSSLVDLVEAEPKEQSYLLALAWLGGDRGDSLRLLWGAGFKTNEAAFLLQVLQKPGNLPPEAIDWVVTRLGELKYRPSVGALIQQIRKANWQVAARAQEALIAIGGEEVESAAKRLLASSDSFQARDAALKILYELKGAGSLPYLRSALSDKELRTPALVLLYHVGTPEDLKVLLPMSDFWTGDRESHYWSNLAIAGIRSRYP